jgi:hypothetical protein
MLQARYALAAIYDRASAAPANAPANAPATVPVDQPPGSR